MSIKIIAVANQKGGVGKTTTTVNLAACLTALRKNVLLVDLDPQANATSGVGMEKTPGGSIYHALLGEASAETRIRHTQFKRLDMIPSEIDLAGAEVDIARSEDYLHRLKTALRPVAENSAYDYIFIDCPPSLGILTMNAMSAADGLLIPIQCEYYALEGLTTIVDLIRKLRRSGANPHLEVEGIVMTMYASRTNLSQQVVQEVATHFGDRLYETMIPRTVRLSEAPSFGLPIILYDKNGIGAAAYRMLAKEFLQRQGPAPMENPLHNAIRNAISNPEILENQQLT